MQVWLQDAVLKIELLGKAWMQHFSQLAAITAHPVWEDFNKRVKEQHQEGLSQAATPAGPADIQVRPGMAWRQQFRELLFATMDKLSVSELDLQALEAQVQHLGVQQQQTQAQNQALLQQVANLPSLVAAAVRKGQQAPAADESDHPAKRPRTEALPSTVAKAAAPTARPKGLVFVLRHYGTVAEAHARYLEIKSLHKSDRRWQGNDSKVAFSQYNLGLAAEVASRTVEELERERVVFVKSRHGALQALACHYTKLHKKKPCARGCPLCNSSV